MEELTLFDGTIVRLQPTPNLVVTEVVSRDPDLANPPLPQVEHKSKMGKKMLYAKEGEPAYAEWVEECARVEELRLRAQQDFVWDYGVVEWTEDGETWVDEPPDSWTFPERALKWGLEPSKYGERVDYIKYHLLRNGDDLNKAQRVVYGIAAPLTEEEVETARDTFPGDEVG